MTRPVRILLVTAGLSAAGTLVGAVTGVGALVVSLAASGELHGLRLNELLFILGLPALIGGVLGGTVGPAIAWALLRHVPLGVAFLVTAAGTTAGGISGWFLGADQVIAAMYGAVIGLVLAALLLRVRYAGRRGALA